MKRSEKRCKSQVDTVFDIANKNRKKTSNI